MNAKEKEFIAIHQSEAGAIYEGANYKIGRFTILWEIKKYRKTRTTEEKIFSCQAEEPNERGEYDTFELMIEKKTLKKSSGHSISYKITDIKVY